MSDSDSPAICSGFGFILESGCFPEIQGDEIVVVYHDRKDGHAVDHCPVNPAAGDIRLQFVFEEIEERFGGDWDIGSVHLAEALDHVHEPVLEFVDLLFCEFPSLVIRLPFVRI